MLPLLLVSSDSVPYSSAGYYAKEYCRENIARYKVPECVDFVEEYPMMASGKIQKYKLRKDAVELYSRPPGRVGAATVSLGAGRCCLYSGDHNG